MQGWSLTRIAGACAVLTTACFVVGIVLMSAGGVQVLIPETGKEGLRSGRPRTPSPPPSTCGR